MVQCEHYAKHLALIQVQYEYLTHGISSASLLIIILSIKRPILLKNEHKVLFPLPLLQGLLTKHQLAQLAIGGKLVMESVPPQFQERASCQRSEFKFHLLPSCITSHELLNFPFCTHLLISVRICTRAIKTIPIKK